MRETRRLTYGARGASTLMTQALRVSEMCRGQGVAKLLASSVQEVGPTLVQTGFSRFSFRPPSVARFFEPSVSLFRDVKQQNF